MTEVNPRMHCSQLHHLNELFPFLTFLACQNKMFPAFLKHFKFKSATHKLAFLETVIDSLTRSGNKAPVFTHTHTHTHTHTDSAVLTSLFFAAETADKSPEGKPHSPTAHNCVCVCVCVCLA